MNNNIRMNFANTTVAFATTSHNHGINVNNAALKNYIRKNTNEAYAKCKADTERRKKRDYIIQHGSFHQAMNAFFTKI